MTQNEISLQHDPEYLTEWTKQQDLQLELLEIERLQDGFRVAKSTNRRQKRATAYLESGEIEHDDPLSLEKVRGLADRRRVVHDAIELQKKCVLRAREAASKRIAQSVLPAYRVVIEKLAPMVLEMARLAGEEKAIRESLLDAGISFVADIEPLPLPDFDLDDDQGKMAHWLREASRHYDIDISLATKIWTRREKAVHRQNKERAAMSAAAEKKPHRPAPTQRKPSVLADANQAIRRLAGA